MTGCPNSTASGCLCPEHHPGLGLTPADAVVLSVVTPGVATAIGVDVGERLLRAARSECPSCLGDPARCRDGKGEPTFARLPGCAAWSQDGTLKALDAPAPVRQPWEPRPARSAA